MLGTTLDNPQAPIANSAGRTDGGGPESLANCVDGLLGQQPLVIVVEALVEQVIEAHLVGDGAEVAGADTQQTNTWRRIDGPQQRLHGGDDRVGRGDPTRDGDRSGDGLEARRSGP